MERIIICKYARPTPIKEHDYALSPRPTFVGGDNTSVTTFIYKYMVWVGVVAHGSCNNHFLSYKIDSYRVWSHVHIWSDRDNEQPCFPMNRALVRLLADFRKQVWWWQTQKNGEIKGWCGQDFVVQKEVLDW